MNEWMKRWEKMNDDERKTVWKVMNNEFDYERIFNDELRFLNSRRDVFIIKGMWYNENGIYEILEIKTSPTKFQKVEAVLKKYGEITVFKRQSTGKRLYVVRVKP